MGGVLVDTSVWIDYFGGGRYSGPLDTVIEDNQVLINDLILAELVPFLKMRKQNKVIALLREIGRIPLQINWTDIIEMQINCMRSGANGVGIPDLIIAQNAKMHGCAIYSLDKHFRLIKSACPRIPALFG